MNEAEEKLSPLHTNWKNTTLTLFSFNEGIIIGLERNNTCLQTWMPFSKVIEFCSRIDEMAAYAMANQDALATQPPTNLEIEGIANSTVSK